MRYLVLFLAWLTPAFIAALFGWSGLWGAGNAALEYLIPIPLAVGALHVPSFIILSMVMLSCQRWPSRYSAHLAVIALGTALLSQCLQLRFDRLVAWFLTDYQGAHGIPIKFRSNPLLVFIGCDAAWLALYALSQQYYSRMRYWLLLLLIPILLVAGAALQHTFSGPSFQRGLHMPVKDNGDAQRLIYTAQDFQPAVFLNWFKQQRLITKPEDNINEQHLSLVFVNSMQTAKWGEMKTGKISSNPSVIATLCAYEEGPSVEIHERYYDCFASRSNHTENLIASYAGTETGLGREVDNWFAQARLCAGVLVPDNYRGAINLISMCQSLQREYTTTREQWQEQYGVDSDPVKLMESIFAQPREG